MFKAGIIGASGYTGYELIKILSDHKHVELIVINSKTFKDKYVKDLYKDFSEDLKFTDYSVEEINDMNLDIIFLAVPHDKAMKYVSGLNCKVIDLSANYRFSDLGLYEKVYETKHIDKKTKATYGLPELFKKRIKGSKVIANPGCYATGMILSAFPIQKSTKYIVFDCKSGWSGAGKSSIYAEDREIIKDNIIAYKLTKHRHKPEVEQFIDAKLSFTPHVIDTFQGMMATAHVLLNKKMDKEKIIGLYKDFYKDCPFVKVTEKIPDIHEVQKTNNIIIGGFEIDENGQLVIVAVLDNLIKGASGQAVQNMNIMLNLDETEGLL